MTDKEIDILTEQIYDQYRRAWIVNSKNKMVGFGVRDALAANTMQMTLNTFKSAGSARSMTSGIEAFETLIYARTPKRTSTTMFFKDPNLSVNS